MTNWRKLVPTFFAFAFLALCLPIAASAQYGGYGNGGYGNGGYGGNNRNYNDRALKDAIKRVKDRSGDFRKHLDQALDHSRINGSNREDQLNSIADQFHDAADDLKDHYNSNGRDWNRSQQDAQRLVQLGNQIDRMMGRGVDGRVSNDWYQIRGDLNYIANAYGVGYGYGNGNGNGNGNGGYPNGRGRGNRWPN